MAALRTVAGGAGKRLRRVELGSVADAWWAPVVIALASTAQAYAVYRTVGDLEPGVKPVLKDSVIFEYIGWYLSTGGRLYVDIWEVKPPLSFELLAILGAVAGDDIVLYHALVILFSSLLIVGSALAIAAVVEELTGDGLAAVAGGLFVFALPHFYWRGIIGFKAKYLVIALGIASLYFALRRRPWLAGAFAAAAVWTWQLAVIFPVVAFIVLAGETRNPAVPADSRRLGRGGWGFDRDALVQYVAGAALVSTVVLLPIVAWGAVEAMATEVVLTPLLTGEEFALENRIHFVIRMHGRTLPFAVLGVLGLAASAFTGNRRGLPIAAVAGWFAYTMLFLDFDTRPDLFPWFAMVAIGVGLAVGWGRAGAGTQTLPTADARRLLAAALIVFSAVSVATMGGFGVGRTGLTTPETYDTSRELDLDMRYNQTERQYLFWNAVPPENCRIFGGLTQFRLVNEMGLNEDRRWFEAPCGNFEPAWQAVRDKYL